MVFFFKQNTAYELRISEWSSDVYSSDLSPQGAHGSWRRLALIAIVRSELGPGLLEHCSDALLVDGGTLLRELCAAINSLETVAAADLFKGLADGEDQIAMPRSLRTHTTGSAAWLLRWCVSHAAEIDRKGVV